MKRVFLISMLAALAGGCAAPGTYYYESSSYRGPYYYRDYDRYDRHYGYYSRGDSYWYGSGPPPHGFYN